MLNLLCVLELFENNDAVLMDDGSPTRYVIVHNISSAIDLTLCFWPVDEDLHGSDL